MICFFDKTYRFWLKWHIIEPKKLLQKWRWLKISKNYTKDVYGYVYVKKIINFRIIYGM